MSPLKWSLVFTCALAVVGVAVQQHFTVTEFVNRLNILLCS